MGTKIFVKRIQNIDLLVNDINSSTICHFEKYHNTILCESSALMGRYYSSPLCENGTMEFRVRVGTLERSIMFIYKCVESANCQEVEA